MTSKQVFTLLLFTSMLIISCEQKQLNGAKVAVVVSGADSLAVKLSVFRLFQEDEIIAQLDIDTVNFGLIELEVSNHYCCI